MLLNCVHFNICWVSRGHSLHIEGKEILIDSNSSMRMKLHGNLMNIYCAFAE